MEIFSYRSGLLSMLRFNLKIESRSSIAAVSQISMPNVHFTARAYLSIGLSPARKLHTNGETPAPQ